MKVGYLITGRLKSTRLPKKLLLKIKGKSIISHMIDRLKLARMVNEIIICTSINEQDIELGEIAKENDIKIYFGDPDDVLLRLLEAAKLFKLDYILNITADCPFVDPVYADKIVEKYIETDADLIRQFDLPHGVFSYGIKVDALKKIVEIKASNDTEVWGRYFTHTGAFNVIDLEVDEVLHKRPGLRITLDYPEDFEFFKAIFDAIYVENEIFSLTEILTLLDKKPEIIKINKDCGAKFQKRFNSQNNPKLKKTTTVSTALIVGAGSIGQRHIRNLKLIGIDKIIAIRSLKGHYKKLPKELGVIEVDNWADAIKQKPEIAIIANPTSLHLEAARKIVPHVKGILLEKPLSHTLCFCQELVDQLSEHRVVSFVGHNLMFHPIVENIMKCIETYDLGKLINSQIQVGQWLPDWHPYEDFEKAYYARKDLGGGVTLTLIHEIHLALELAGLPSQVFGILSGSDKLNIDVDVCSDLLIKHQSGVVSQIHLDFIQKPAHRSGLITFEKGWLNYDFTEMKLTMQRVENDAPQLIWSVSDYDNNIMYEKQLKEFVDLVEQGWVKNSYDVRSSIETIKVVDALFESHRTGMRIDIEHNERFSF